MHFNFLSKILAHSFKFQEGTNTFVFFVVNLCLLRYVFFVPWVILFQDIGKQAVSSEVTSQEAAVHLGA
jgi:hypothetical protein